jgi:hypothetical protein
MIAALLHLLTPPRPRWRASIADLLAVAAAGGVTRTLGAPMSPGAGAR